MSKQQVSHQPVEPSPEEPVPSQSIDMKHGYEVQIGHELTSLQVTDPTGQITLKVLISEDGPVIQLSGSTLAVEASEKLSLRAKEIDIQASERLRLTSEGEIEEQATLGKTSIAEAHSIRASLGDVVVKANDDIKLNGERVKLNCDE